jgi:hypothetical protein
MRDMYRGTRELYRYGRNGLKLQKKYQGGVLGLRVSRWLSVSWRTPAMAEMIRFYWVIFGF